MIALFYLFPSDLAVVTAEHSLSVVRVCTLISTPTSGFPVPARLTKRGATLKAVREGCYYEFRRQVNRVRARLPPHFREAL